MLVEFSVDISVDVVDIEECNSAVAIVFLVVDGTGLESVMGIASLSLLKFKLRIFLARCIKPSFLGQSAEEYVHVVCHHYV